MHLEINMTGSIIISIDKQDKWFRRSLQLYELYIYLFQEIIYKVEDAMFLISRHKINIFRIFEPPEDV